MGLFSHIVSTISQSSSRALIVAGCCDSPFLKGCLAEEVAAGIDRVCGDEITNVIDADNRRHLCGVIRMGDTGASDHHQTQRYQLVHGFRSEASGGL